MQRTELKKNKKIEQHLTQSDCDLGKNLSFQHIKKKKNTERCVQHLSQFPFTLEAYK